MQIFETSETVLPLHNSNNFACFQVGVGLCWTGWEHTTLTAIQLLSCSALVRWGFLISWCLHYWVSCNNNNRVYQENCLFFKFSKNINLWLGTRIFILSQIVYFYPEDEEQKSNHVGLIEGLVKFMSVFR